MLVKTWKIERKKHWDHFILDKSKNSTFFIKYFYFHYKYLVLDWLYLKICKINTINKQ